MEFTTGQIRALEVYKEAWALMKPEFWPIFGIVIVGMLVGSVVPIVIMGPMMIGVFYCLLEKVDGRPASFDRLFKGFDQFGAGLTIALMIMLPIFAFIFLVYIPMIMMTIYGQRLSQEQLLPLIGGFLLVELLLAVVMTLLHSLLVFAFPLIADRRMGGFAAAKLSAHAAWANKGGIAGLFGVGILVVLAGYMLLCVGVYLALPVIMMATTVAYRKVFPHSEQNLIVSPPPPDAYLGL
ncbi:MAG: hypothetical protein PSX80_07230 [bacterium]|nr:hypothetical protein [bacterium]